VIAPRSPWQNAYAERVIGSIRRECLDHVVVMGERHLLGILSKYVDYYNGTRTHLSLAKDAPRSRSVQLPSQGRVVKVPRVGGLHHEYLRRRASPIGRITGRDSEAATFFEQALPALYPLPDTRQKIERAIDLRLHLRQALFPLNELATVWRYLEEAEGLARTLDDSRRLGWVSAYMSGHHLHTGGHVREVRTFAHTVEAIAERLDDVALKIAARYYVAHAFHLAGDSRRAEDVCRRLMPLLRDQPTRERFGLAVFPAVMSRGHLARVLAERWRWWATGSTTLPHWLRPMSGSRWARPAPTPPSRPRTLRSCVTTGGRCPKQCGSAAARSGPLSRTSGLPPATTSSVSHWPLWDGFRQSPPLRPSRFPMSP